MLACPVLLTTLGMGLAPPLGAVRKLAQLGEVLAETHSDVKWGMSLIYPRLARGGFSQEAVWSGGQSCTGSGETCVLA